MNEIKIARHRRRGSALLVVIILSAVFGAMSVAYVTAANASLNRAQLYRDHRRALAMAETGLKMAHELLPAIDIEQAKSDDEVLEAVAAALNTKYQAGIFGGSSAVVVGDRVIIPAVTLNFSEGPAAVEVAFVKEGDSIFRLESRGQFRDSAKSVTAKFKTVVDNRIMTTYGIASRSRIKMLGNGRIIGVNDPLEGSVLSTTYVSMEAVDLVGNVYISGNVAVANPEGSVRMRGNTTVGGDIIIGAEAPEFPAIDISPFVPYATNVIDHHNPTTYNGVLDNIIIKAGTNPTFNGNTVIRGVVYIESPNNVRFTGNLKMTGVIVAEDDGGPPDLSNNTIFFAGNVESSGVESLPYEPQFDGLHELTGSFALVPGFSMTFRGNFSAPLQGTLAASKFDFGGNCSGTIRGSVLNYHETDFEISGNSEIRIDHDGADTTPTGMHFPKRLVLVEGSYEE